MALAAVVLMSGVVAGGATRAFAYGAADQPVAQVEISGNCDNPNFPFCAPPPDGVGLGGVWVWAELDTGGGFDATVTFCGHQTAGQPNGAFGNPDTDPNRWWTWVPSLADAPRAFPFFDTSSYSGPVYVIDFFPSGNPDNDFVAAVPAAQGHYPLKPAPGVSIETQVAP